MKMYAIADKYNEDFFWNFVAGDFLMTVNEGSLMPTKELAQDYIEEQLGSDCVVAEITVYQITKDEIWEYSVQNVWNGYVDENDMEVTI